MARNAEKAMTTLARWRAAKEAETGEKDRRPYLASECSDLPRCEKYRLEIIREVSKKVAQIQNAGLGEFRIRDLNDEINKLLREKRHWENQISSLGGPHYRRYGPKMFDSEGREVPGNRGYKYFGAAKDLPGVRELFEQEPPPPQKKTRAEMMKDIDADYYGYRDDDDGILIPLELAIEKILAKEARANWSASKLINNLNVDNNDSLSTDLLIQPNDEITQPVITDPMELLGPRFISHVPVPAQKDVESLLLYKRKQALLQNYGVKDLTDNKETM